MTAPNDAAAAKASVRARMRTLRRSLDDRDARSAAVCVRLASLPEVHRGRVLMAYTALPGEPDLGAIVARWRAEGRTVVVPEDEPPAGEVDVVVVPGLAYTPSGIRLGQGGGWYDRFLPMLRPDAVVIGVAFEPQIVDDLPVEDHDVGVAIVVTEASVRRRR